jgi:PAS domain S-box-containing protein
MPKKEKPDITSKSIKPSSNKTESYYRTIFEQSPDGILIIDTKGRIIEFNEAACRHLEYSREEFSKLSISDIDADETPEKVEETINRILRDGIAEFEVRQRTKSGAMRNVLVITRVINLSGRTVFNCIWKDITDHRRADAALQASEKLYRLLAENSTDIVTRHLPDSTYLYVSPACRTLLGYEPEELIGRKAFDQIHPEDVKRVMTLTKEAIKTGGTNMGQYRHLKKDGTYIWVETVGKVIKNAVTGNVEDIICVVRDITDRKRAEEELRKLNRTLLALNNSSQALTRAKDEDWYLNEVCRIVVEDCGHALVWIGYAEEEDGKSVRPVAFAGFDEGYIKSLNVTWDNMERGRGPVGTAIRTGKPAVFRNMLSDPRFAPWREDALKRGYAAAVGLPLLDDERAFGSLTIYSRDPDPFSDEEVKLLADLADDLAYGIKSIRLRAAHVNSEEALRQSEEHYRTLFENMLNGYAYCRMLYENGVPQDFIYLDVNPAFEKLTGLKDVVGRKVSEVIRGIRESDPELLEILGRVALTGVPERIETHIEALDMWFWISVYSAQKEHFVAVFDVITERKKAEDDLRLFKNLINQANDAILVIDPATGRFLDVNAKACNNLGYGREELLKMVVLDIDDIVIPDTLSWKAHVDNVKDVGHVFLEGRHRRKDGTTYPVEVNVKYISLEKGDYMVAVARDITERKKAEEALQKSEKKYKDLFDSTLDGIYQMDADGVFILMNPAGAKMFGYESPDEMIGRKGLEFWRDPGDRDVFREELKTKKSVNDYHMKLKKKNGEPIELETSSTIKEDEKGAFLGMEGILRDVTERQKLEDQLRQSQKMEAVGQLAGGIAHDFNNILTAMIGYGHLLKMKLKEDDPLRNYADNILSLSDKAANLTHSLLAFSRKQIMNPRAVDINEIIRRIDHLLSRIIGEDIRLQTALSEKDLIVMADPGQIEQVLMNLVANARDSMPKGGLMTIMSEPASIDHEFIKEHGFGKEGEYALISLTDTGAGMDRETREKIFEPFFTTKEVGKGTGLGLAMVYGIVKQHEGFINVYSEPDRGTTFRIYLPLTEAKAYQIKPEVVQPVELGGETVLLAEDETEVRVFTKHLLEEYGYKVMTAADGQDAIDQFKVYKNEIQLVLLDVIMPNKSGKEVYDEIKQITPDIKVLFMSGYPADIIQKHDITEKGFAYIEKPASPTKLLRKIREVLDKNEG